MKIIKLMIALLALATASLRATDIKSSEYRFKATVPWKAKTLKRTETSVSYISVSPDGRSSISVMAWRLSLTTQQVRQLVEETNNYYINNKLFAEGAESVTEPVIAHSPDNDDGICFGFSWVRDGARIYMFGKTVSKNGYTYTLLSQSDSFNMARDLIVGVINRFSSTDADDDAMQKRRASPVKPKFLAVAAGKTKPS